MNQPAFYLGDILLKKSMVTTSSSGNPQVALAFNVHSIEQGGQWATYRIADDEFKYVFLSLSSKAWPYTQAKLESLEFGGDFKHLSFGNHENIMLECRHEIYQGEPRERWELYGDWGTGIEPAGDDVIARLNAQYQAEGGKAPTPPPNKSAPAPVPAAKQQVAPPVTAPNPTKSKAPAPPSPAKAESTEASVDGVTNKDDAWAYWMDNADKDQLDPEKFYKCIRDVYAAEEGRNAEDDLEIVERAMTESDWQRVAKCATIPF